MRKQKIVYFLIIVMALAFVYLRFSQMFQVPKEASDQITVGRDQITVARDPFPGVQKMYVGNVEVSVEIANTQQKKIKGLSGHEPLLEKQGMFFPMGSAGQHSFWMKDMKFPLDILWIRDNKIVDISDNVPAPVGDELPIMVQPKELADAVLEMNSDFTEKYGIVVGNKIEIKLVPLTD